MICIHCLGECEKLTEDHLLHEGWYPPHIRVISEKLKIPACKPCNNQLGKYEDTLFSKLMLGVDPKHELLWSLSQKNRRSYNPYEGKSVTEVSYKARKKESLRKNIFWMTSIPDNGVIPGFGSTTEKRMTGGFATIFIGEEMDKFAGKMVKGAIYHLFKNYVRLENVSISVSFPCQEFIDYCIQGNGSHYTLGDIYGFYGFDDLEKEQFVIAIKIWEELFFCAFIPKTALLTV